MKLPRLAFDSRWERPTLTEEQFPPRDRARGGLRDVASSGPLVDVSNALILRAEMPEVLRIQRSDVESNAAIWNRLAAGNPFLSWEWLGSWWNHFGDQRELFVLAIHDGGHIQGFAPWYIEQRPGRGRVVRFLGSGKASSDHLTLLCEDSQANVVAAAVAEYLVADDEGGGWDHLELTGVDAEDVAILALATELERRGHLVSRRPGVACYSLDLASGWDAYLEGRSKGSRRRIKRWIESCGPEQPYELTKLATPAAIKKFWPTFIELHQQRRRSLGESGCFDEPGFEAFLAEASDKLAAIGQCHCLVVSQRHDGRPIAVEYLLTTPETTYYYQSGIDPDSADARPGSIALANSIRNTILRRATR